MIGGHEGNLDRVVLDVNGLVVVIISESALPLPAPTMTTVEEDQHFDQDFWKSKKT